MRSSVVIGCIYLTVWFGFISIQVMSSYSVDDVSRLEDDLLSGYKVSARPAEKTFVSLSMLLSNVLELDIVEQICSISTYIITVWKDSRLQWNETVYGGTTMIFLQSDQIWRPPLYLNNAAREFRVVGDESHQRSMPVFSHSSGRVLWYAPGHFVGRCESDVSNFPFDKHTCKFVISTWLYSDYMVQLRHGASNMIDPQLFEENSEWMVTDIVKGYEDRRFYYSPYRALSFSITLQRRTSYYVLYVLVPVVVFNIVGAVVFAVPPGSGEKLTFSLTMLLAITVLMTIVGEKIPTSSMQVSKLGVYLVCSMVLSILEVIITVLILRLYNAGLENKPVNRCWLMLAQAFHIPFKIRFCCRSKDAKRLITVSPLVTSVDCLNLTAVESTDTKGGKTEDLNLELDNGQEKKQFSYKEIAVKMDRFCLCVSMTFAVLLSIGFLIASAVN